MEEIVLDTAKHNAVIPEGGHCSPARNWDFVVNNYTEMDIEGLLYYFNKSDTCTYYFQEEIGDKNKTPHLQGVMIGQTRIREAGLNRWGSITQSSGNAALISLTKGYSTRSFFGLSRGTVMARADLKGTIAANPAEQCFFHIWAAAFDGTSNPTPVLLNVSIVYSAIFSEPRLLVQS